MPNARSAALPFSIRPSATPSCALERHGAGALAALTLPELFAAQAARTPDAVAVVFEDRTLTYAALDAHANRLAHHLQGLGVGPETVVGLCVERSPEMVIGLLGILKAGGAYLPLDAGYPRERLEFMLADAGVAVLVTQSALVDRLPVSASEPHRSARCRRIGDRAPARHRAAARHRSAPPGLRHLHLGLDRRAQGRCRRARKPDQQDACARPRLRGGRAFPRGAFDFVGVRSLDRTGLAAFDGRRARRLLSATPFGNLPFNSGSR